ncbi:MAG TPA: c-type cytochrome biogenesis protein CcsB [Jiangellaceae bacterium]
MDLDAIAGWSREVVALAIIVYVASWAAFCAELGLRSRLRRLGADQGAEHDAGQGAGQVVATPALASAGVGAVSAEAAGALGAGAAGAGPDVAAVDSPGASGGSDLAERAERTGRIGRSLLVLATVVLGIGVVMRGVGVGRTPWGNMYEFSITGALVASVVFLIVARKPIGRALSAWVVLLLFVTLALAVTALYVPPGPLVPALRSYWLVIHVGCAVLAFGLFTVGAVVSALQIMAERAERRGATKGFAASLPDSVSLDRLGYRLNAIAFPVWTFGPLILGAIWAEVSWGRYWNWDPKEVWALVTWLVFAAYLHARATAGWKGSKASIIGLVGYGTVLFSYFGVNILFSGLHSYGGL